MKKTLLVLCIVLVAVLVIGQGRNEWFTTVRTAGGYDGTGVLVSTGVQSNGPVSSDDTVTGTELISTVEDGTPPLTVSSTTQVANLNAEFAGTADEAAHATSADSATTATSAATAGHATTADSAATAAHATAANTAGWATNANYATSAGTTAAATYAASAGRLHNPRTINGVSFDGTANITVYDATKEPVIAPGIAAQYWRGDKTWQTLDKSAVGLGNVDNTADANKNVLSATKWTTARTINGTSVDGTANVTIPVNNVNDTTTNATVYLLWTPTAGGNYAAKVTTDKLYFNPFTGMLTATGFTGPLTGSASQLLGATWAAPGAIGSGTPTTIAGTTGTFSGNINANSGTIASTAATVNVDPAGDGKFVVDAAYFQVFNTGGTLSALATQAGTVSGTSSWTCQRKNAAQAYKAFGGMYIGSPTITADAELGTIQLAIIGGVTPGAIDYSALVVASTGITTNKDITTTGGDIVAGANGTVAGTYHAEQGAGGNTPGYYSADSANGTKGYMSFDASGVLHTGLTLPAADTTNSYVTINPAAPPALGGTTPAAGKFTTLDTSGNVSLAGTGTVDIGAGLVTTFNHTVNFCSTKTSASAIFNPVYQNGLITFNANDTEPSVMNGTIFKVPATWTAGNNITFLSSPLPGYPTLITIIGGDSDCVIVDNADQKLAGNWTAAPNATLQLVSDGTAWYEVSRSNNG